MPRRKKYDLDLAWAIVKVKGPEERAFGLERFNYSVKTVKKFIGERRWVNLMAAREQSLLQNNRKEWDSCCKKIESEFSL